MSVIIFDMDGLMFDTGRLAYRAYFKAACLYDFTMTHDVYYYLTGRTDADIRIELKKLYGEDADTNLWRDTINGIKKEILEKETYVPKKKRIS